MWREQVEAAIVGGLLALVVYGLIGCGGYVTFLVLREWVTT